MNSRLRLDRDRIDASLSRWRSGERSARDEIARLLLEPLVSWLRSIIPGKDPNHYDEAAENTILEFLDLSCTYQPGVNVLEGYLARSARRNLIDVIRSNDKKRCVDPDEKNASSRVELVPIDTLYLWNVNHDPIERLIDLEERSLANDRICEFRSCLSDIERVIFDRIIEAVHDTAAFAEVLNVTNRSIPEQRRIVKLEKDRILAKWRRFLKNHPIS
jgi:hypothetical protein